MKTKLINITRILFILIPMFLSLYFIKIIRDLDMIPSKYFIVLVLILILINLLVVLLIRNSKLISNIIGIILSILIIIGSMFGIKHGTKISNIINKAFGNSGIEVTGYSVAVLKSSKYNKIEDLDGELMGYVILDDKKDEYMAVLKSKISVELKSYDDPYTMYEDLLNKKVNSIIVSEGFLQVLEEEHEDIYDRIKIIYNFEIEEKISTGKEDIKKLEPINILISGSDSRSGKIVTKTRSDVNMIMTINPKTRTILLTSIPRDYYVQLHNTTGLKDKLTHAGIYGIEMTKTTLEDLFDIKIDYTVKVGFNSVIEIVDYIGGIDIESDKEFTTDTGDGGVIKAKIKVGKNHLNGGQALAYARERHAFKNGDYQRVQNQQQVIEAIIDKISKDKKLLKNYDELLEKFSELYRTDIPSKYIKLIVKQQLDDMKGWKIEKQYIKGYNAMKETYSMPGRNLFVVEEDKDSINEAKEKINNVKDGK